MYKLVVLSLALAVASASYFSDFAVFKAKYNKVYEEAEEDYRRGVYQSNMERVRKHNEMFAKNLTSFYMGENQFADWTNEEFVDVMNGMKISAEIGDLRNDDVDVSNTSATVDWRQKGYVTPVKNQGRCGSCWAFSSTGSLEGQHFAKYGRLVSLSESNLVDCSQSYGNHGCNGGLMQSAFRYIHGNGGIDTEASYPYVAKNEACKFSKSTIGATDSGFVLIRRGSEAALQRATAQIGPISVAIDANHYSFQMYKGGVYVESWCSSTRLDHGVLVVGYGTEKGQDYWLVKNSWSKQWGDEGYIKMARNRRNMCGIATNAVYPVV